MDWKLSEPFDPCFSWVLKLELCSVPTEAKLIGFANVSDWEGRHSGTISDMYIFWVPFVPTLSPLLSLASGDVFSAHALLPSSRQGFLCASLSSLVLQSHCCHDLCGIT